MGVLMHGKPRFLTVVQYAIAKIGLWLQVYHHFLMFVRFDASETWFTMHFNRVIESIMKFFQIHVCANTVLMRGLPVQFGGHQIAREKIVVYHAATARFRIESIDFYWRRILPLNLHVKPACRNGICVWV